MARNYVFGPVASRRLGVSLGVDLVRPKTCSLDCVYCEAGATTERTRQRREYVPTAEVIRQLDDVLGKAPELDFVTFSGAGEPTLHSGIGEIVRFVKSRYPQYRLCLLTNATTFTDPAIFSELDGIDLAVPSLDASDETEFRVINRPAEGLSFAAFLDGLRAFCEVFRGAINLELFIVPGVNDSDASIRRFVSIIRSLKVARVQLNTLDRPGVVDWIKPSDAANTRRFIAALEPFVPVEAVGPYRYKSAHLRSAVVKTEADCQILELAARRPVTLDDLTVAVGLEKPLLARRVADLLHAGLLEAERRERGEFFRTVPEPPPSSTPNTEQA